MKRLLIFLVALLFVTPLFAEDKRVPVRFRCDMNTEKDMERTFCTKMEEAFSKLDYLRQVPNRGAGEKIFFDFKFAPIQPSDSLLAVGVYIGYSDTRFNSLQLAVFTGTMVFSKPTEETVIPDDSVKSKEDAFSIIANNLMVVTKEWFDGAKPVLDKVHVRLQDPNGLYTYKGELNDARPTF